MLSAAELASMTTTVAASLDVTVTVQRRTPSPDGFGHTTEVWNTLSTPKINVVKPSDTTLQAYADVIGSQRALVLRFMPTTDIQQNDQIIYLGKNWKVQEILNAESYTIGTGALITAVV
jgi:hypothetical protein